MPIIPGFGGGFAGTGLSTTVQNIIDGTAQDIRQQLSSTTSPTEAILIDYCNRVSLAMLRVSRWAWLLSPLGRFVTETQVSDYWIGATGSNPSDTFDTGLNITNLFKLKDDSVYDRTNNRRLLRTDEQPALQRLVFQDASPRAGRPLVFRNDPSSPYILSLYPAPDNQTTYQPVPEAPAVFATSGGALTGRIYYVTVTYVDSTGGESIPSTQPAKVWVPANNLLVVQPPLAPISTGATGIQYSRYNVYAGTTSTSLTKQASNIATSANWTEPTTGLVAGAATPSSSTIEPIDGYIIEFRYFAPRIQLTDPSQIIQIPDFYKDIVIAGVNSYAFQYLNRPREAMEWKQLFQQGITQIIHDKNLFPGGAAFIRPDSASISTSVMSSTETFDSGISF